MDGFMASPERWDAAAAWGRRRRHVIAAETCSESVADRWTCPLVLARRSTVALRATVPAEPSTNNLAVLAVCMVSEVHPT